MIPKRFLFVLGTFLLSILLYVDRACISAAEDAIGKDLQLDEERMGWIFAAFSLGYALCQTPAGWLADRLGPRRVLSAVVGFWSLFTGLTACAWNFLSLLTARLLFGAGEAGAFPGMARAAYSWIPMGERGLVQGINFSGSRLGGAFAFPLLAWMIAEYGWRTSFAILMGIGFAWALLWLWWFRDDPTEHRSIDRAELDLILAGRQAPETGAETEREAPEATRVPWELLRSPNAWAVYAQYFCSNFTFFFTLTWLLPHLKDEHPDLESGNLAWLAAVPLVCGAVGNWVSGALVDRIYRRGRWSLSRRLPAMTGFLLAALGLLMSLGAESAGGSIAWISVAILGADMTLAPSWSACIDIGQRHAGVVSGTMNMAGNVGAFLTALAFPYLKEWTQSTTPFFFVAAGLNLTAVVLWLRIRPERPLEAPA